MKKITYLLLFSFMTLPFFLLAQSSNRQYLGLSIGPSFPLSDFAKQDMSDSTSGFANTGVALNFTYAYRLSHNFGIMFMVDYSSNKLNNSKYGDELALANPGYGVTVESARNWSSGGLFGGPYFRFPIGYFSIDFRGMIGYYASYSPKATIHATLIDDQNQKETYYRESTRATGFGYLLGVGGKYRINDYYLTLFADYVGADLNFKDATGWGWDDQPYTTSFTQKINYLSITIGIAYIL